MNKISANALYSTNDDTVHEYNISQRRHCVTCSAPATSLLSDAASLPSTVASKDGSNGNAVARTKTSLSCIGHDSKANVLHNTTLGINDYKPHFENKTHGHFWLQLE